MKRIITVLIVIITTAATIMAAQPDRNSYEARQIRADRYFSYKEWPNALAMYLLMVAERPDEVKPYYKAIVAGAMNNDSTSQMEMFERTQQRGISLDSLFCGVRAVSFSIGEAGAYCDFLLLVKKRQPWLARNINIYLLDYYDFRNDPDNVIKIAEELLSQTPDNTKFIKTMARAYINKGEIETSATKYKELLTYDSHDYDALLFLGNYYAIKLLNPTGLPQQNDISLEDISTLAQTYLHEAYKINPTPYVATLLDLIDKSEGI